ncbi:hypothetical protein JG687_00000854, partial [Phytophthora cactorum]
AQPLQLVARATLFSLAHLLSSSLFLSSTNSSLPLHEVYEQGPLLSALHRALAQPGLLQHLPKYVQERQQLHQSSASPSEAPPELLRARCGRLPQG